MPTENEVKCLMYEMSHAWVAAQNLRKQSVERAGHNLDVLDEKLQVVITRLSEIFGDPWEDERIEAEGETTK